MLRGVYKEKIRKSNKKLVLCRGGIQGEPALAEIQNQCYVLGVKRIGKDPMCEYCGGTAVVDPFGFADVCPDNEAFVLTKTLDLKRLKAFREKFPVLQERD